MFFIPGFGGGSPPPPPPPPPPPTRVDPSVQAARQKQVNQAKKKAGLSGNIRTPALLEDASIAQKTLLGN